MCSEIVKRPEDALQPEKWTWSKIRAGEIADFNAEFHETLDPGKPEGWGDERKISAGFLRKLFLEKMDQIPFEGVRIIGAFFPEGVALEHGRLHRQLWLEQCRFEKPAIFRDLEVNGWFSLEGSFVAGQNHDEVSLNLSGAKIKSSTSLRHTTFNSADLTAANIRGNLYLSGATVTGDLNMNSLTVGQGVFMRASETRPATFNSVDLRVAKIEGQLILNGATVTGHLDMNRLTIELLPVKRQGFAMLSRRASGCAWLQSRAYARF